MTTREFWCAVYIATIRLGTHTYARQCADDAVEALKLRSQSNFEPPHESTPVRSE